MLLHPDYSQCIEDHAKILVLINDNSKSDNEKFFNTVYSTISKNHEYTLITSSQLDKETKESNNVSSTTTADIAPSDNRNLKCRFITSYTNDNNAWGEFQTHRFLLGLISVAVYSDSNDLEFALKSYERKKDEFSSTLLDSRIILVRKISNEGCEETEKDKLGTLPAEDFRSRHTDLFEEVIELQVTGDEQLEFQPDSLNSLQIFLHDYLANIFKLLDARKREFTIHGSVITKQQIFTNSSSSTEEAAAAKSSSLSILLAPIEKKESFTFDIDKKSFQKRCLAREKKRLGDLYLQCGYPNDALAHYVTALDSLKQVNDWLWVGGCLEGICAATLASSEAGDGSSVSSVQLVTQDNIASPAYFRRTHNQSSSLRTVSSTKTGNDTPKASGNAYRREPNLSLDLATTKQKRLLHYDEIIKKYEEVMKNYKKYSEAAMITVEAAMKACRLLMKHDRRLDAAKFLENVIFINLQATHKEDIFLYYTLSELYSQLKFYRKSAFYKHYAAMKMMDSASYNSALHHDRVLTCMRDAIGDTGLTVDLQSHWITGDSPHHTAWFQLQAQLIGNLIQLVELQGRNQHIINYSISLIDRWHFCLEKEEIENYIEKIKSRVGDLLIVFKDDKYEVELHSLPVVRNIDALHMPEEFRPYFYSSSDANNYGVFIYTPLIMTEKRKEIIYWVKNEQCNIRVHLYNGTLITLTLAHLVVLSRLTNENGQTSSENNLTLDANMREFSIEPQSNQILSLQVMPQAVGKLQLTGIRYQLVNLGDVWSTTFMSDPVEVDATDGESPEIVVISDLPQLDVAVTSQDSPNSLQKSQDGRLYNLFLLHGEYLEFSIVMKNKSSRASIDFLSLTIQHSSNQWQTNNLFEFNNENLQKQLPLLPSKTACIDVYVYEYNLKVVGDAPHASVLDSISSTITLKYWNSTNKDFYREVKVTIVTHVSQGPRLLQEPYINGFLELPLLLQNPGTSSAELRIVWRNSEVFNSVIEASACKQLTLPAGEVRRCLPQSERDDAWLQRYLRIEWRYVSPFRKGYISLEDIKFIAYLAQFTLFEKIDIDLKLASSKDEELANVTLYRPLRLKSLCKFSELSKMDSITVQDLCLKLNVKVHDRRDVGNTCFSGSSSVRANNDSYQLEMLTSLLFLSSGAYYVYATLNYTLSDKTEIELKSSNCFDLDVPAGL